jgi:hypothetical protein
MAASAQGRTRGSSWTTYQNMRFGFALKYPADVFRFDAGPANARAGTWAARKGHSLIVLRPTPSIRCALGPPQESEFMAIANVLDA